MHQDAKVMQGQEMFDYRVNFPRLEIKFLQHMFRELVARDG